VGEAGEAGESPVEPGPGIGAGVAVEREGLAARCVSTFNFSLALEVGIADLAGREKVAEAADAVTDTKTEVEEEAEAEAEVEAEAEAAGCGDGLCAAETTHGSDVKMRLGCPEEPATAAAVVCPAEALGFLRVVSLSGRRVRCLSLPLRRGLFAARSDAAVADTGDTGGTGDKVEGEACTEDGESEGLGPARCLICLIFSSTASVAASVLTLRADAGIAAPGTAGAGDENDAEKEEFERERDEATLEEVGFVGGFLSRDDSLSMERIVVEALGWTVKGAVRGAYSE